MEIGEPATVPQGNGFAIEVDVRINVGVVLSIVLIRRVCLMYTPLDTLSPFLYNSDYGRAR